MLGGLWEGVQGACCGARMGAAVRAAGHAEREGQRLCHPAYVLGQLETSHCAAASYVVVQCTRACAGPRVGSRIQQFSSFSSMARRLGLTARGVAMLLAFLPCAFSFLQHALKG